MSFLSARALARIQATVESAMVDVIEVWRGTTSDHDEDTLIESSVAGTKIYDGKARIRPTSGPREQAVGEGVIVMRDADINVPLGEFQPRRDDEVLVKTTTNPALQDSWFRVTDVILASQQASQRFSVIQAQPTRLWPLEESS